MRQFTPLLAAGVMILSTAPAAADLGDQLFKLLAEDGAEDDEFGYAVAIGGPPGKEVAIVGAYQDGDNGTHSGSAYLFDAVTGRQIAKLLPDDGAKGDYFGRSVAIGDMTAIIGTPLDNETGFNSGSAYLFDITTGQQIARLLPNDAAERDYFGRSVAISGTTVIIGASGDDDNGDQSGSAYIFDTTTGQQIAKLLPNDGAKGDAFGRTVAVSGDTAVVGAYSDDDNGFLSGSAYLFDTSTGQQIAKLLPDDGEAYDQFGRSVAISGATVIVGANADENNGLRTGSAYLFDSTTGQQIAKLLSSDGAASDSFGDTVAINSTTAIVGASGNDDFGSVSGSAYLFDLATGQELAKLLPDDGAMHDRFGGSVGLGDDMALISARYDDDNGSNSGSAYLFDPGTGASIADLTACSDTFGTTDNPPCDVENLVDDDDVDQILRSQFGFSAFERNLTEIVIEGNGPDAVSILSIGTRDGSDTTNVVAKVKARNYVTNSIDDIAQYNVSFPSTDTSHTTLVNSADYINANGDIEVRLRYVAPATFTPLGFIVGLDQVEMMVQ